MLHTENIGSIRVCYAYDERNMDMWFPDYEMTPVIGTWGL